MLEFCIEIEGFSIFQFLLLDWMFVRIMLFCYFFSITEFEFCYTVNISFPLRMVIQEFLRLYKVSVYRQSSSKNCVIYFYINFLLL